MEYFEEGDLSDTGFDAGKHLADIFKHRTDNNENDIRMGKDLQFTPMIFYKRAPMRFGKRNFDKDFDSKEFLRSIRAPMRFGKRGSWKQYDEERENDVNFEEFGHIEFSKRAPMRFGKRNNKFDDLFSPTHFEYPGK